jgi:hypothetical protein
MELQGFAMSWDRHSKLATELTVKRQTTKKRTAKKPGAKRELIAPRGDKRYIRRDAKGRIKESDDVGRSLSQDRRRKAKTAAKAGQGDRGDRKPAKASARKKTSARR